MSRILDTLTATDERIERLSRAADAAYPAWERAPLWRRREAWRRYEEANAAYWKAFHEKDGKETIDD